MKYFFYSLILPVLIAGALYGNDLAEIRFAETPYIDARGHLQLEVDLTNFSRSPIQELRVFYRELSENHFKSRRLRPDGLRYLASVDLSGYTGSVVEYYIDVEFASGEHSSYPRQAPEENLLTVSTQDGLESGDGDIVIISPEPGERIYTTEFVLTVSFFQISSQVDPERTRLFLNNWDVSRYVKTFEDFLTFAPKQVPPGKHKLTLRLYDRSGRQIAGKVWNFDASERTEVRTTRPTQNKLLWSGNAFAENRNENLTDGLQTERYAKVGLRLTASTESVNFGTRLFLSNQENDRLQPINRYSIWFRSNFWNKRYLRLAGGDVYPAYNPQLMYNTRLRGFHGQLNLKFINFDFATGITRRGIPGFEVVDTLTSSVLDTLPGVYDRTIQAARLSFGNRDFFQLGLSAVKGRDDLESVDFAGAAEESFALGSDLFVAGKDNKIVLEGGFNLSVYNPNILNGKDTSIDTLQALGIDVPESAYNFARRFITVNQYLIVYPGIAYDGLLRLNFIKNNRFSVGFRSVNSEYNSFGQQYLLRDNRGFTITDNIRLLQNQLFLNMRFQKFRNNLDNEKPGTTDNRTLAFNLSYFPIRNLPSISVGFTNYARSNDIDPDSSFGFVEDNSSNTINFSTSVPFAVSSLSNRLTLNIINYNRTDDTDFGSKNLSNTVLVELNTRYSVPLKTRMEFTFQQTENTLNFDQSLSELGLNSFGLGLEYRFNQLFSISDALTMSANGRFGSVSNTIATANNTFSSETSYRRNNFNGRLIYTVPSIGRFSFNGDFITYSGDRTFRDYILTARYDVTF